MGRKKKRKGVRGGQFGGHPVHGKGDFPLCTAAQSCISKDSEAQVQDGGGRGFSWVVATIPEVRKKKTRLSIKKIRLCGATESESKITLLNTAWSFKELC